VEKHHAHGLAQARSAGKPNTNENKQEGLHYIDAVAGKVKTLDPRATQVGKGSSPLRDEFPKGREGQLLAEAQLLGTLCRLAGTGEQRIELVQILGGYRFLQPEHQILFESIRALLLHDGLCLQSLAVNLNNRGFPDVGLENYSAVGLSNIADALTLARRCSALAHPTGEDVR
jgi:hypothetical protein